ncbi:serine hydrolase domain-containing protein [Actinosynnema sp. NPDC050436]|uniref:serine hydrolase domain-containing protein n=1 Tax=Actinosynnema sp. NPDC050436 TaxID=3155659 RepID=UPI0033CC8D17
MERKTVRRRVLAGALALVVLVGAVPAHAEPGGRVGAALEWLVEANEAPGAQAVVTERGRSREIGRGTGDLRTGKPFPRHSRVRIGSNTKSFVATVVLQLVAQGRVGLDAPVERYLPGLVTGNGNDGTRVTVRHVLQHTGGLPEYLRVVDLHELRWTHVEPVELVRAAMTLPPDFEPGTRWSYSNTGYVLAGLIVEAVTGRSIGEEITRRVLVPLGLASTYYPRRDETGVRGPHPRGYHLQDGGLVDYTDQNMSWAGPAGAMVGTGEDLNRFFTALLAGRLLPPALLAEMKRTVPMDLIPGAHYGLGLVRIPTSCGKDLWGHGGGLPGFLTRGGVTEDGRAVNVTVNRHITTAEQSSNPYKVAEAAVCD